jgi:hypothetical protein
MNQGGGLQRVVRPLTTQIAVGQPAKFLVNQWSQLVKDRVVTVAPRTVYFGAPMAEQPGN